MSGVVAQDPVRPESYQLAIGMQERGMHEEAAKYLQAFLKTHADHALVAEGYYRLAQSQLALNQPTQAIDNLKSAVDKGGDDFTLRFEACYRIGNLLQAKGDQAAAASWFEKLNKDLSDDHYLAAATAYALGEARREAGDDEQALFAFAKVVELAADKQSDYRFPALYQSGFANLRLQRFAAAAEMFAKACRSTTDDQAKSECHYLAGDAQLRLNQFDQAASNFRAAKKIGGQFADDAQLGLGWCAIGTGNVKQAAEAFGTLLLEYPKSTHIDAARIEKVRCLYQQQKYGAALSDLKPLLERESPLQQQALELQGLCVLASGDAQAAVAAVKQALIHASLQDRSRLQFALGEAHANLGNYPAALQAYQAVGDGASAELRGDAMYGACHAQHEMKQHEASIASAQQVLAIEPPHQSRLLAQFAIAENQFALAQYAKAEASYRGMESHPDYRNVSAWKRAWCLYLLGQKKNSAKLFAAIGAGDDEANAEEAMAMHSLALFEAGDREVALAVADQYRARYQRGRYLARTERIAASVLRARGDLGAAQRRLQRAAAIAKQRDGIDAAVDDMIDQADLAYQQGDFEESDKLYAELTERRDSIGSRAKTGRAWCAFELGDDVVCAKRIEVAKAHPIGKDEMAGILELESAMHHRQEAWAKAVDVAREYLRSFPEHEKSAAMRYALGVALARSGDQKSARKEFASLLQDGAAESPGLCHYELAWAAQRDGDEAVALQNFRMVADQSSDPELVGEACLFVGVAFLDQKPQDLEQARPWLGRVSGRYQKQALYRLAFAEFEAAKSADKQVRKNLLSAARDHFQAIVKLDGDELVGESLFLEATCCRKLDDHAAALPLLAQLLRKFPDHERVSVARLALGESAMLSGQPDLGVAPLEEYLRTSDANTDDLAQANAARANLWLGRLRMARKQHESAESCFGRVIELSDGPLAAEAQFRIGQNRALNADLNGAVDAYVKLPILYANAQWVRRGLLEAGMTYELLKQPKKASRFYRELVEKHKGSPEAKRAASQLQSF
jgi:cellulose synthase operon protein C